MATRRSTYVYVHLPEGPVPAGQLVMVEGPRSGFATFRYGDRYLQRPDRVPLDPVALPLPDPGTAVEFATQEGFAVFGGLRDAAPDGWGRHLMDRAAGPAPLSEFDYLVNSGDDRVGALAFGPDLRGPRRIAPWSAFEPPGERLNLEAMLRAAERLDEAEELDEELRRFVERGSSLGGARPKATTQREGTLWIAKFGRKEDRYDVCRAEFAAMTLAARCGLDVPRVALEKAFGRDIYLVERFDRIPAGKGPPRRLPFISGLTLLGAHEQDRHHAYRDLADALRQHGSRVKQDCQELFRRMVFNILCNNVDDHLRNHGFLFDGRGWRLSPAYDLLPIPEQGQDRKLALAVGSDGRAATLANALSGCEHFGYTPQQALKVVRAMQRQAAGWRQVLQDSGLSKRDLGRLEPCFAQTQVALPSR